MCVNEKAGSQLASRCVCFPLRRGGVCTLDMQPQHVGAHRDAVVGG